MSLAAAHRYFILNKPYNMVSQFVSSHDVNLLRNIDFDFPEGTHAIGRLDNLSEGLLIKVIRIAEFRSCLQTNPSLPAAILDRLPERVECSRSSRQ